MKINYRILSVDDKEKSFTIRYFTDITTEEKLANLFDIDGDIVYDSNGYPLKCRTDYNVSLFNENDCTEENVNIKIINTAPVEWLGVMDNVEVQKTFSMANVEMFLNKPNSFEVSSDSQNPYVGVNFNSIIEEAVKNYFENNKLN